MKKIIVFFIVVFLFVGKVNATCNLTNNNGFCLITDPKTHVNISGRDYFGENLEKGEHPGDTYLKVSNKNELIYCSDGVMPTDELSSDIETFDKDCKEITTNKNSLIYSYEYGYGEYIKTGEYSYNKDYLTGEMIEDYYITQTAVWNFCPPKNYLEYWTWFDGYDFASKTFKGITDPTITRISNLINDAKAAESASPSLEIKSSSSTMYLTSDGKYYISGAINLIGSYLTDNISISVSGLENVFVTKDKDSTIGISSISGGTKSTVSETLYIKVPVESVVSASNEINLKVSSKSSFNSDSKIIECSITKETMNYQQPMIKYVPNYATIEDTLTFNIKKYPVNIKKTDNAGNLLVNGKLVLEKNDKIIETWNTTDNAKIILLDPGIYTISEIKAPNGYIYSGKTTTFKLDSDGKIYINNMEEKEVVVVNNPIIISVSKKVVKKDSELAGAKLRITDKEGSLAKDINGNDLEWISEDKPKKIHIAAGTYMLEEIEAPEGYELSDKIIEFTVKEDGTVVSEEGLLIKKEKAFEDNIIVFENTPTPEQVPTGNVVAIISSVLCVLSLGVSIYFIAMRKEI